MKEQRGSAAPLALIVVLLAMGALIHLFSRGEDQAPVRDVSPSSMESDLKSYRSNELGFEIKYPRDFVIDEDYHYKLTLPSDPSQNPIPGVAFILPSRLSNGTNLGNDSKISIEVSGDFCRIGEMYGYAGFEDIGGLAYKKVVRSSAGAGNLYEETLYSTGNPSENGGCYGFRMFMHSINIDVAKYDKDGITKIFKDMIKTIAFIK